MEETRGCVDGKVKQWLLVWSQGQERAFGVVLFFDIEVTWSRDKRVCGLRRQTSRHLDPNGWRLRHRWNI
jgi:hypothetical protein